MALDLSSTAQQTVNANLKITLASGSAIENLTGGNGSDTLTGNTLANTLTGNAGNDALDGGAGNDTYAFVADTALGNDTIADASGTDTISFAGTAAAVALDLSLTAQQTVNANLKITLASGSAIENLSGLVPDLLAVHVLVVVVATPGVVDEHVDPPVAVEYVAEQCLHLGGLGVVAASPLTLAAGRPHRVEGPLQGEVVDLGLGRGRLGAPRGAHDVRTRGGQLHRNRASEPARGAGHECHLSLQRSRLVHALDAARTVSGRPDRACALRVRRDVIRTEQTGAPSV